VVASKLDTRPFTSHWSLLALATANVRQDDTFLHLHCRTSLSSFLHVLSPYKHHRLLFAMKFCPHSARLRGSAANRLDRHLQQPHVGHRHTDGDDWPPSIVLRRHASLLFHHLLSSGTDPRVRHLVFKAPTSTQPCIGGLMTYAQIRHHIDLVLVRCGQGRPALPQCARHRHSAFRFHPAPNSSRKARRHIVDLWP